MRARAFFIAALAVAAVLLVACAGPNPAAAAPAETSSPAAAAAPSAAPQQGIQQLVEVTFYAAADNDPPGSVEIAYPNSRHPTAGGTGTAADPLCVRHRSARDPARGAHLLPADQEVLRHGGRLR